MTCQRCKLPMREVKGHICHGNRKWRCKKCGRARMQSPKKQRA